MHNLIFIYEYINQPLDILNNVPRKLFLQRTKKIK